MTHLTVREWARIPVYNGSGDVPPRQFSRQQANALLAAAQAHPLGGKDGAGIVVDHHLHLTAQQLVGVLAAPGCSLEILPKIDDDDPEHDGAIRLRLVRMLDVAYDLKLGAGEAATIATQNQTLLEVLIILFTDRLLAEARRGLPRTYVAQEDDLAALRGRLNTISQFTHNAARPDRLSCRFDTLMADTPLMRIMKACVIALRRSARLAETVRRLDELRFLLADVSDITPRALPWMQVRIDRTNRRWETLYGLARLFLKREWQGTHHDASAEHGVTLLFPMNSLFEAYITALARRALRGSDQALIAQGGRLNCLIEKGHNGRELFQTKPDILLKNGAGTAAVIDTKWKRIGLKPDDSKHGIGQADVYQMMAYARLYQCDNVMLLYPHHSKLQPKEMNTSFDMLGGKGYLWIATVDLASDETKIVQRLQGLFQSVEVANPG
jgi:5-methylcytosine-specific restriction enzyme subunit McrC